MIIMRQWRSMFFGTVLQLSYQEHKKLQTLNSSHYIQILSLYDATSLYRGRYSIAANISLISKSKLFDA